MLDRYTRSDCEKLRRLIVEDCINMASNGLDNYIFLSGGMDSITVLYGFMAAKIPFKAVNFKFKGIESADRASVEYLQKLAGFDCIYIDIESDEDYVMKKLPESVRFCKTVFGRIRKVKVETIFMLSESKKHIPKNSNVYFSRGDRICGYHKNDAILAAKQGDECQKLIDRRMSKDLELFEMFRVFSAPDYNGRALFVNDQSSKFMIDFKIGAINHRFPKSMLYYAFEDYHKRFKTYRNPIGFHKASGGVKLFEDIAKRNGFKSALQMFNAIAKKVTP